MAQGQPLTREAAGKLLLEALESTPASRKLTDAEAESLYAQAYREYGRNNYAEALATFRVLVAFRPADKTFVLGSALCLQRLGQWDAAIAGYTVLSLIDPTDPAHLLACAECQLLARRRDAAEATLAEVIAQCRECKGHEQVCARAQAILELLRNHHEPIAA